MKLTKIISSALAVIMLMSCIIAGSMTVVADSAMPFEDVKENAWFYDQVLYVYENGLMAGTTDNTFSPRTDLSRAMFITILGRMVGAVENPNHPFTDIPEGGASKWYVGYIGWAYEKGIVSGTGNGKFSPNAPMTRESMAVAVDKFITAYGYNMTTEGGMITFNDQDKVSSWAANSIAVLRNSGIVQGDQYRNFMPQNSMTRDAAATVFMKLDLAIKNAWQGYLPTDDDADEIVLGASYLYWGGSVCAGGMGHSLDKSGEYPVLEAYMDAYTYESTYHAPNTIGVAINELIDIKKTPYVKIAYGFDGMENESLSAYYYVNMTTKHKDVSSSTVDELLTLVPDEDDCGMKTAIIDLSVVNEKYPNIKYDHQLANLIFKPCDEDYDGDGRFEILYVGFFESEAEADAFTASSDSEIDEYLKEYEPYSSLKWYEYTDSLDEYYDTLLVDRIAEIKNSESELTPEMIEAAGGTCYYFSSIRGDDNNDGKSPETPWKSLSKIWRRYDESLKLAKIKPGDGIFFERGSEWYAETYHNASVSALHIPKGVSCGAYGEGPKPLFTVAINSADTNGKENWLETEWENVYVLKAIDKNDPEWGKAGKCDIGTIYFNGGEAVAMRVVPNDTQNPFGEGKRGRGSGYSCTGLEYYYASRSVDFTNPGTALEHNLQFIHDQGEGKLYLYFDKGNPGEYFDDIKIPRSGPCAWFESNVYVDNLAFMYSTEYGARANGNDISNVKFTNCEIGCVGGGLDSIESGIEIYGATNGAYFYNNYIHDVGDGSLTSQFGVDQGGRITHIQNVEYVGNVMVASGHGAELWNDMGPLDENGYAQDRMMNLLVKDNIMAYIGYGLTQKQAGGEFVYGNLLSGSMYGEISNSYVENNIFLHGSCNIFSCYMATYEQDRGWCARNNTYVFNTQSNYIGYSYETLNMFSHHMWKRIRISFPYSYEGLVWYTSLGIDPQGTYYYYSGLNEHEEQKCFFMTGYWAERGGFELAQ